MRTMVLQASGPSLVCPEGWAEQLSRCAEFFDQLGVLGLGEPVDDAVCHDATDAFDVFELALAGGVECIECGEGGGEVFGGLFADVGDAETVDEAPEFAVFAVFEGLDEVIGRFCGKFIELQELLGGEVI